MTELSTRAERLLARTCNPQNWYRAGDKRTPKAMRVLNDELREYRR